MADKKNNIYVLGKTTTREVYVIKQGKAFSQNEYLIIEDEEHGNIIGEVMETNIYPMIFNSILPSGATLDCIKDLGYDVDKKTSIGKLKVLNEISYPVTPTSNVRKPIFDEIKHLLINAELEKGMLLGVIKGTEELENTLPMELKNIVPLWSNKVIVPQREVPFIFNHYKLKENPGLGFFGGSGSGKTVALRTLCEELMDLGIPGLAFDIHFELDFKEPTDGLEGSQIRDYSDKYEVFEIGDNLGINFEELKPSELVDLLEFSMELSPAMRSAITSIHSKGDGLIHLKNKLNKLKIAFDNEDKTGRKKEELSEEIMLLYAKHKLEISGSGTLQAILWRLVGLEKQGLFRGNTLKVERAIKNCKLAVLRSSNTVALQMLSAYLIKKMYKKRRKYKDFKNDIDVKNGLKEKPDFFPMFFVILDEAHNFAPNSLFNTPSKRILKELSQEGRKYGVYEVFATQLPNLMDPTMFSQISTKFIFRINTTKDIDTISREGNLTSEQASRLPDLTSGNCFVVSSMFGKVYYVQFRTSRTKSPHQENPFDELEAYRKELQKSSLSNVLMELLPIKQSKIPDIHANVNRVYGSSVTVEEIVSELEKMARNGDVSKKKSPMGCTYEAV
jgi:Predicted ATPase